MNPAELVLPGHRLFIDTNVFLDSDQARDGALKGLFQLAGEAILAHDNPIVIPGKVIGELTGQAERSVTDERSAAAKARARNALQFLDAAYGMALIRHDLGGGSNPYADDLFVELFRRFAAKYAMCLITYDVTLLLRIRLLAQSTGLKVRAGLLDKEGMVVLESDRALFVRGTRKLERIRTRISGGAVERRDERELASLTEVLDAYRIAFKVPQAAPSSARAVKPFTSKAPYRGPDLVITVSHLPTTGDTVRLVAGASSESLPLGDRIGAGGEGVVYALDDHRVAKIFARECVTVHRREKIALLVARGLRADGICFPEATINNHAGEFVGYAMSRASGREFQRTIFNPRRFLAAYPHWMKSDLVDVCISFLEKVAYLHSHNIVIGDINPKNLLVDSNKDVWIIDADSWQLEGYPSPVGTAMFTAPAIIGKYYPDFLRSEEDEAFAVATMLFMILITGQFPYARAGSDGDIVKLIREGNFAFQYKGSSNKDQPEGNWKFMWSHVDVKVKETLWATFHRDGARYARRPRAQEWLRLFQAYRARLASDATFDPMSNDVYPTRFKARARDTPIYDCERCGASMAGIWHEDTATYSTPPACWTCRRGGVKVPAGRSTTSPAGSQADLLDPARLCTACKQPFISFGNVTWHERTGRPVPMSHKVGDATCDRRLAPSPSASTSSTHLSRPRSASGHSAQIPPTRRTRPAPAVNPPQASVWGRLIRFLRDG